MQYGNCSISCKDNCALFEFKSYYVVWKLDLKKKIAYIETGLNRTMQYGNYTASDAAGEDLKFKSYYVVWKLKE